ncbi:MAG TPA: type II toxin-antitoxin system RelE/ParE family toxin [Thermoanaerobaculia bacterium]|nr:type II toxin-antitoxin system RelE/ParE family toxin [Thermoanaerobaculia bacterium]
MNRIEFTKDAIEDLRFLKKLEQRLVVDAIERQLSVSPEVETRNRKPLRPNEVSMWELRVNAFRVFYDIEDGVVRIKAVGRKEHNRLVIRGKEFLL